MIEEILVKDGHPFLASMAWTGIPKLAVITGLNGSGKTALLEQIHSRYATSGRTLRPITPLIEIKSSNDVKDRMLYIPVSYAPDDIALPAQISPVDQMEKRNSDLLRIARSGNQPGTLQFQSFVDARNRLAPERSGEPLDMSVFASFSDDEIIQALPLHFSGSRQECENNKYVTLTFQNYLAKLQNYKAARYGSGENLSDEEIYKRIGMPPPWEEINEIFRQYGFPYLINQPIPNSKYTPEFTDQRSGLKISFNDLSDGEKIMVSLILWAANGTQGTYNDVFLFDEIDAHLNPSLAKMMMEVISDRIVAEYGIQVIMTTHSPSTVAYTPDESLFWLERGVGVVKGEKERIIPLLSDGIITVAPGTALKLLSKHMDETGKPVLFVEGETDLIILDAAWAALRGGAAPPFEMRDAFDCYMLVNTFRRGDIFNNYRNRGFVGLIDFDDAYKKAREDLVRLRDDNENKVWDVVPDQSSGAVVFERRAGRGIMCTLTVPEHRRSYAGFNLVNSYLSIELLFSDEVVERFCRRQAVSGGASILRFRDNKKTEFANSVEKFDASAFSAFEPLLSKLEEFAVRVSSEARETP